MAARLEALAEPGGICVSRVVRDQVRDKLDFGFEDRGEQQVKNIARPVRVYRCQERRCRRFDNAARVQATPTARQAFDRRPAVHQHVRRPGQEYFADGIVEDIITALSRLRWSLRHRPQFELHLQGPSRGREAGRRANLACATCSKAACARPAIGCA